MVWTIEKTWMDIFMKRFKVIKKKYKGYKIFSYDNQNIELLKNIIDNKYIVEKEYKNDKRTYVAKIIIKNKTYIIKRPHNNKILKRVLKIFQKAESLVVFLNNNILKQEGLNEVIDILGAVIRKKNGLLCEEFYLMEYIDGVNLLDDKSLKEILETSKKIHKFKRFHGDCNPFNFLITEKEVKIIDSKLKKMWFGNYRAHYDILTLFKYFKVSEEYPYDKNIFYYLAYFIRKIRNKRIERGKNG